MRRHREPPAPKARITGRMAVSDARLVERIPHDRSGEELRELYRRYAGELFGFACNALGDR